MPKGQGYSKGKRKARQRVKKEMKSPVMNRNNKMTARVIQESFRKKKDK